MAHHRIKNPEDLVECPYDPVHMIRNKKLQYHIMKCRRNYAGMDYVTCPFNARHEFPHPERLYHIANCPDKAILERELSQKEDKRGGTMFKGNTEIPIRNWVGPEPTEDWDAECFPNPRIGIDESLLDLDPDRPTFRDMTGMKPSEKKELKRRLLAIEERRRKGLPLDDISLNVSVPGPKTELSTAVRQPKSKPQVIQAKELMEKGTVNGNIAPTGGIGRGVGARKAPRIAANFNQTLVPEQNGHVIDAEVTNHSAATNNHRFMPPPASSSMMASVNSFIPPSTMLLGIGRGAGRGIGRGSWNSSSTNSINYSSYLPSQQPVVKVSSETEMVSDTGDMGDTADTGDDSDPTNTSKNNVRKLTKKLREIQRLEEKSKNGEMLNAVEQEKILQKIDLVDQLSNLQCQ